MALLSQDLPDCSTQCHIKYVFLVWLGRRQWHPTPVLLPGKSHGWRSLVGCSPWGRWELDMTQWLHFHFSLSCIGEGNGNPLQCSCLENPRDDGAWWAAIYGVAQSRTRLKWLNSSSSSSHIAGKIFTSWGTRKAQLKLSHLTPLFLLHLKISGKFQSIFFCFQVFYYDLEQVTGTLPQWMLPLCSSLLSFEIKIIFIIKKG